MTELFEDNIGNGAKLVLSHIKSVSAMLSLVSSVKESDIERHLQAGYILICEILHWTIKFMHVMEHSNT